MKKWADKVMQLATVERRRQEEARAARSGRHSANSSSQGHYNLQQSSFAPLTPATEAPPFSFPPPLPNGQPYAYMMGGGDDDDDGLRSGRTTPSIGMAAPYMAANPNTGRRVQSQQSAPSPADRAELRARAMTEDQFGPSMSQWRSQQPPPMPRLASNASASSEASFGPGVSRGGLRMNTSRLCMAEEMDEEDEGLVAPQRFGSSRGMTRAPSHAVTSTVPYPAPSLRNRSASSPNVHPNVPKGVAQVPAIPSMSSSWAPEQPSYPNNHGSGSSTTLVGGTAYFAKRMSAGNRSSGGSTETSETTSSSPATPYGMMNGELRGPTPVSRQNSGDGTVLLRVKAGEVSPSTTAMYSANMQNAFIVSVAPDVNYATLYQKVLKKIRLGRPVSSGEIIQLKWIDSDDDEVSLRCDADIEAMFGEAKDSGMGHVNIIAK
jgi:cell division control protein 24